MNFYLIYPKVFKRIFLKMNLNSLGLFKTTKVLKKMMNKLLIIMILQSQILMKNKKAKKLIR
jgi:hypothetical protein